MPVSLTIPVEIGFSSTKIPSLRVDQVGWNRDEQRKSLANRFSLRRGLCFVSGGWFSVVDHSALDSGCLSLRSTSTLGSAFRLVHRVLDSLDL